MRLSRSHLLFALVVLLIAAQALAGCATARESVRAVRQYSREPASLMVALDRLDDLEATLALVNRMLMSTPYSPGDGWVSDVALGDEQAETLEREIRRQSMYGSRQTRVSVPTLYVTHVERVLASPESRSSAPQYGSILEALAALSGPGQQVIGELSALDAERQAIGEMEGQIERLREERREAQSANQDSRVEQLQQQIRQLRDQVDAREATLDARQEAVDALMLDYQAQAPTSTDALQILEDLVSVVSVCARMEAEAAALVPVIGTQVYRSFSQDALGEALRAGIAVGIGGLPDIFGQLGNIGRQLAIQYGVLRDITRTLASMAGTRLRQTPGYELRETAVDAIAGFALDSIYIDAEAGAEALFFNFASADTTDEATDGNISYDFTGQQQRVDVSFDPIVVADFAFDFGFDLGGIPQFFNLDLNYATDRVYRSGGSVETSTEAVEELGLGSRATDALAIAMGVVGAKAEITIAHFNSGQAQLVDVTTNTVVEEFPLQLEMTSVDAGYDVLWLFPTSPLRTYIDQATVTFRYMNYSLPRILYEFEDTNGDPDVDDYVLIRESRLQDVNTRLYLGGAVARRGPHAGGRPGLIADLGLFLGGGPVGGDFDDPEASDVDGIFAFVVDARLGWAQALLPATQRFQLDLVAFYDLDVVLQTSLNIQTDDDSESDLGERTVTYGGADLVHGPTLRIRGSF